MDSGVQQVVEVVGVDDTGVVVGGDDGRLAAVDGRPDAEDDDAEPAVAGVERLVDGEMTVDRGTGRADQQTRRPSW